MNSSEQVDNSEHHAPKNENQKSDVHDRANAAERFEVSVASAVKWLQRWRQTRSATPKPRGGSISALEEFAAEILALIAKRPDLTLVETVAELRKRRIPTSSSSCPLDRFWITSRFDQLWPER